MSAVPPEPTVLEIATQYVAAGLSVLPIKLDKSKKPTCKWKHLEEDLPTAAELQNWFGGRRPYGIAIINGAISGNKECIDFDEECVELFPKWTALVEEECPGLVARLTRINTPRPGVQVHYRCTDPVAGNDKLAQRINPDDPKKRDTLIETRGEGGYAVAPGSPLSVHENGTPYIHVAGPPLTALSVITSAEREVLLRCARVFDRIEAEETVDTAKGTTGKELKPGDDFCARGPEWEQLLEPAGWTDMGATDGITRWRRPGKEGRCWSATTGCKSKNGRELLCVFSTNAHPFPGPSGGRPCSSHSKFSVYAILNHDADYKAAAKDLASQGYGDQTPIKIKRQNNRNEQNNSTTSEVENDHGADVGDLRLVPGACRQTASGKLSLSLTIMRGSEAINVVLLTSSASSRKEAVRQLLAQSSGDVLRETVENALGKLLAEADQRMRSSAAPEGPTLAQLIGDRVPDALLLTHRTARGLWSERLGREIVRNEFLAQTSSDLLAVARTASDVPAKIPLPDLLRLIDSELRVLWADLLASLPLVDDAESLKTESAVGRQFRAAITTLWTAARTFEIRREAGGDEKASRSSLASRVRNGMMPYSSSIGQTPGLRERWRPVHNAFSAWWRPYLGFRSFSG